MGCQPLGKALLLALGMSQRSGVALLRAVSSCFDEIYDHILIPEAADMLPDIPMKRMPGRKLLISSKGNPAQLLHLDSLYPSIVANVYLRGEGEEEVPIAPTTFLRDPETVPPPASRDYRRHDHCKSLLSGGSWLTREKLVLPQLQHNQAVVFAGNVIHGGPKVTKRALRIVAFQYARPQSLPDEDLSDFQEFEFSMQGRVRGTQHPETRRALRETRGRWRDHFPNFRDPEYLEYNKAD